MRHYRSNKFPSKGDQKEYLKDYHNQHFADPIWRENSSVASHLTSKQLLRSQQFRGHPRNVNLASLAEQRETQRVWDTDGKESKSNFTGKGPKSYRKSDERIHEEICELLSAHPEIDASNIEVSVKEGEVILSGTVESRPVKRLAEDICEDSFGVVHIHNQLKVAPSNE